MALIEGLWFVAGFACGLFFLMIIATIDMKIRNKKATKLIQSQQHNFTVISNNKLLTLQQIPGGYYE